MLSQILDWVSRIAPIIVVVGGLIGTHIWAYRLGRNKAEKELRKEALLNRYKLIYVPLNTLLLGTHITTVRAVLYPTIRRRVKRAWPHIKKLNFKIGFQKLLDKYGTKTGAEVEFGRPFPLSDMIKIIKAHAQWADKKLLILLQQADRSRYESPERDQSYLTDEELALEKHIWHKYTQLNRKLMPE
ncbi:hypothetical protein E3J84_00300 [Candidatus Aerophobetes bacterium]|uniref:Uncharacterized protein n=1 Tax=Aerophobetes bacterium TaxID=2030807 RepID=A0A523S600_UNCAE|nr:MAG: hypothetical protein E3J84_00300 [Candidatus Aerophobetes bacterium]